MEMVSNVTKSGGVDSFSVFISFQSRVRKEVLRMAELRMLCMCGSTGSHNVDVVGLLFPLDSLSCVFCGFICCHAPSCGGRSRRSILPLRSSEASRDLVSLTGEEDR